MKRVSRVMLVLPVVLFHPSHNLPLPPRNDVIIVENLREREK